jgi:hypothetical protein
MAAPKKQTDNMPALAPTNEEIAERAYEIFLARGGEPGHELDDWLQAELELLREQSLRQTSRDN